MLKDRDCHPVPGARCVRKGGGGTAHPCCLQRTTSFLIRQMLGRGRMFCPWNHPLSVVEDVEGTDQRGAEQMAQEASGWLEAG